ncbi:MAG: Rieske 2Fe-2S domain-containing protein [Terrimonas sp.]|nr:Rieske 2Fe-2S domain-containing protein [Terrimonas sp.]
MTEKKINWVRIADDIGEIDFAANKLAVVELKDKKVCLAKSQDTLYACAYKCPHAGGILAEGHIDALGNIVCPVHRYKFSLQNGRNVSGEGYYLKNWPVEIREDGVYIGIEATGGFWDIFR